MHAPHLLRGLGIAVIVSAVLTLSACGISYDVTIHDDDTLDQTILIWDSGGVMGKSDCSAEGMGASGATAPAGADITYTFTDHNGDPACRISARGIPVSEFSGSNNSMSITHNDGKFDVTVPSGDASAKALYDDSDSSYSVTFPGKVIKASGNATIDGNTVTWNNYLEENGDLHAVGKDSPDRPWTWVAIGVAVVAVVVSLAVWVSGSYPATWQLFLAQASVFLGIAWSVFQVLSAVKINGVSLINWAGALTPGGETVDEVRKYTDLNNFLASRDATRGSGGDRAQ